jgi:nucleoside-diphosphate-sugar epimerase
MNFITGATGLIGAHLLYRMVSEDLPVRALFRNHAKLDYVKKVFGYYAPASAGLFEKIEWVQGDILDYCLLTDYIRDATRVFHTAAEVSLLGRNRKQMMETNVSGTANVVNACLEAGTTALCHVSSISSLGVNLTESPVDENQRWNPAEGGSVYAISKLKAEMEVWRGIYEGLPAVIVNPGVVIGPGMWKATSGSLFRAIYKGLKYYPVGSAGYVDVRDVISAMLRLTDAGKYGERFIVVSENLFHKEVFAHIALAMQKPAPQIALTPFLEKTLCLEEKIRQLLTSRPPRITAASLKSAAAVTSYSNRKISGTLDMNFIPIKEALDFAIRFFMEEFTQIS